MVTAHEHEISTQGVILEASSLTLPIQYLHHTSSTTIGEELICRSFCDSGADSRVRFPTHMYGMTSMTTSPVGTHLMILLVVIIYA
jgi:hypothetical protein